MIIFIMASGQMPFDDSNVGKMLKAQNQENINYLINSRCGGSKELKVNIEFLGKDKGIVLFFRQGLRN